LKAGTTESPGVDKRRVVEGSGAYHYRGNTPVLEVHGVVHTARGTGPSIRDGCDHEVTPL
jgi:hypothetical protein